MLKMCLHFYVENYLLSLLSVDVVGFDMGSDDISFEKCMNKSRIV